MNGAKNMKGFFFVLATFIVLVYMVASITLWAKSLEVAERSYAEKFKISNLDLVVSQISKEKVEKVADIAAYHALYSINSRSVASPIKGGDQNSRQLQDFYIKRAFWKAISNGTFDGQDFQGEPVSNYDTGEIETYTISGWFKKLNSTISSVGLKVEDYSFERFDINQSTIDTLNYTFRIKFNVSDSANLAYIERDYEINGTLNITGLQDPALLRESSNQLGNQFFFLKTEKKDVGPYETPKDLTPAIIVSGGEGQGWFYGPIVTVSELQNQKVGVFQRNSTILVGTYDEITNLIGLKENENNNDNERIDTQEEPWGKGDGEIIADMREEENQRISAEEPHYLDFGAYILTNEPEITGTCDGTNTQDKTFNAIDCDGEGDATFKTSTMIDKPFAVIPGFNAQHVKAYQYANGYERRLLFVNKHDAEEVKNDPKAKMDSGPVLYNIEELRDMAICGYYVKYPYAPSYFQRLLSDPYSLNDEEFGMETFVFGKAIGGENVLMRILTDERSRIDRELYSGSDSSKIRGMPGCKNAEMCISESPIGHFRISLNGSEEFIGKDYIPKIVCDDEECGGAE